MREVDANIKNNNKELPRWCLTVLDNFYNKSTKGCLVEMNKIQLQYHRIISYEYKIDGEDSQLLSFS